MLDAAAVLAHIGELPVHVALEGKGRREARHDGHSGHDADDNESSA